MTTVAVTTLEAIPHVEGIPTSAPRGDARGSGRRRGSRPVLRVRDEARNILWCCPGLLRFVTQLTIVGNGSTDGTPQVASAVADTLGMADRLTCWTTRSPSRPAVTSTRAPRPTRSTA